MDEPRYISATRAGYDTIAEGYAKAFSAPLRDAPLERGLLAAFAEYVHHDHTDRSVVEVGSGPGDITAHLHDLHLEVRGIDLSPNMVELARRAHPHLSFEVGEISALDLPDGALAAVVSWYSLIHVAVPARPAAVTELRRVLRPGGYLLMAFQVGEGTLHFDDAFGQRVDLDFHRLEPAAVRDMIKAAGFELVFETLRAPLPRPTASAATHGFVLAQRPATPVT